MARAFSRWLAPTLRPKKAPNGSRGAAAQSYQNVRGELRRGTVFIVPAGHPATAIASRNNNLQILCFEVNAKDNVRLPLAGKNNVVSRFEREAKELAFGVPVREVDRVFNKQDDEFFLEGPSNQQQGRIWSVDQSFATNVLQERPYLILSD